MQARGDRPEIWRALAVTLCAIVALVVATEAYSFVASRRMQTELHQLMKRSERTTYLLGDLGTHAARLHSNVLEALTDHRRDATREERMRLVIASMEAHASELPGLFSPEELQVWKDTEPSLQAFLRTAEDTLEHAGTGFEDDDRREHLGELRRRILDWLGTATALNQRETEEALARKDALMARTRILEVVVGGLLFLSIAGIAFVLVRALRRKEREHAGYLREIEAANSDLEAFAGRVAHDLRNTLAPVHATGEALALASDDPELVRESSARLQRSCKRAEELITGLLAFARAGAAPAAGASALVDPALEDVLEELAPSAERTRATIELDVETGAVVGCEPALLHAVLTNLLSNALKFLEGRPARVVRVRVRIEGERCIIEIADTGPGIPPAMRERIFEPFFRAPGATPVGQGIGLATVRRIVDAHGGVVALTSEVGVGTTFRVALPLRHVQGLLPSARRSTRRETAST